MTLEELVTKTRALTEQMSRDLLRRGCPFCGARSEGSHYQDSVCGQLFALLADVPPPLNSVPANAAKDSPLVGVAATNWQQTNSAGVPPPPPSGRTCDGCEHLKPFDLAADIRTCVLVNIRIAEPDTHTFGCNYFEALPAPPSDREA